MVPALRPVMSIMPLRNLRVRFFVPQPQLSNIGIGNTAHLRCDTCPGDLTAKIYFIANQPEYPPPVIHDHEEGSENFYLIQARTNERNGLHIGQPVSVLLSQPRTSNTK